ncbi:pentapeptide repeat-containing protein [Pyxidicoccus xibeiensis]|uniref:pentapeptide repeat-containing protein n=1 Tax=Pyxidicoccus xibeiensis TaxID=2906759 RepID=UPI0020A79DC6|nr:pentapeptide repeat-containing protein [Pyxidicoccus xibeiensis]MCP3137586.1 pentapeptide repeat-containing protein [Pyxidicoccus xibeiensis]
MRAEQLVARWNTPDGQRRREQLMAMGLCGAWRDVLAGFPGTEALGDNRGDLRGIDLTQQELSGADLVRARLDGALLDDCGLQEARMELATLSEASLTYARLERANLTACVALGTRWDDASLEGAVFTASNLARSSFRRARLRDARFDRASLNHADLRNADLRDTSLYLCDLEDALLTNCQFDPPRVYPRTDRDFVRHARRVGFPSFVEPLLMAPRFQLVRLTHRDALLHVEAGVEASTNLQAEVAALWKERLWHIDLMAATAMVLGGTSEHTLTALWERLDHGTWVLPQLTVVALLTDPDFATRARTRVEASRSRPTRLAPDRGPEAPQVRECLEWALQLREQPSESSGAPASVSAQQARQWLKRLQEQVDPRIQADWHFTPPRLE